MGNEGNELARVQSSSVKTLADAIASRRESFAQVASEHFSVDRLIKLAQAALSRTPELAKCTQASVLNVLMQCAELGAEPNAALPQRRMWLIPRWNKKVGAMECTGILDYRAQLQLARDTALVEGIAAERVHEKDFFEFEVSTSGDSLAKIVHKPVIFGNRGDVIGYYAAARLERGEVQIAVMSEDEACDHRDRFAQRNKDREIVGPWTTDFYAMALKSVCRKLWNLLPAGNNEAAIKLQAKIAEETADEISDSEPTEEAQTESSPRKGAPPKTIADLKAREKAKKAERVEEVENPDDGPPREYWEAVDSQGDGK